MSTDRRRGLGKGLGALIPSAPTGDRPSDVFFPRGDQGFTGNISTSQRQQDRSAVGSDSGAPEPDAPESDAPESGLRTVPGAHFAEVLIDDIAPNPRQPRQVFDEDDLAELVASITELGVLQPVVVRPTDEVDGPPYELVMGERRLRACRAAGKDTIPAIIRVTEDEHMLRDALLENLHRAGLNPLEEAAAYQQLLDDFGCTHDILATRIGRSRPQISNTIRLLKLPPLVQRRVASGVLSAGHARALLGLGDGAAVERLAQRIVAEGLSVRSVEEIVLLGGDAAPRTRGTTAAREVAPELERAAHDLSERLETRVQVVMGRRKGKITVEFAGQEDLERILAALSRD
ncbi:MAG: ParB/RepB/Spo0J family partition protein [Ornithinimicrobium sp.]|uniref:ParB/RepB/Spo0J family partition protein n=1 Tax=Ornithinimicrobium sp. TaxID=1977084 RepID=UPI0026DEB58B|nr:ParB/RepB/Spo0J family partition protein [Ornithinimicrobium sp.]MDO5739160.1 ParB/RepB/Spo0J family partition protein [Ornithinimicrobium sp.]